MQERLATAGIEGVRRFEAIDAADLALPTGWRHSRGAYGCLLSHLAVVREARRAGWNDVLVLEDDVVFPPDFEDRLLAYSRDLPSQWDMLMLGGIHLDDLEPVSRHVHRVRRSYSTIGYVLRGSAFDGFLANAGILEDPIDVANLRLQRKGGCYCFMPHLVWVEAGYSDAQGRYTDHWYLRESLVLDGESVRGLLARTCILIDHGARARGPSSERNLHFLLGYYRRFLAGVSLVVLERAGEETPAPSRLPAGCHRLIVDPTDGSPDLALLEVARSRACAGAQFFVLCDSDVFVDEWSIRGNLLMCREYDRSTGFSRLATLTAEDTARLHSDSSLRLSWLDATSYRWQPKSETRAKFEVMRRSALESRPSSRRRLFESPNPALRMSTEPAPRLQPDEQPESMAGPNRDYTRFVVVAHQRSGSSLVINTLRTHPEVVSFGELFYQEGTEFNVAGYDNRSRRSIELRNRSPIEFLETFVFTGYRADVRAVGFKVFPDQLDNPYFECVWRWLSEQKDLKVIALFRDDLLATYTSLLIAEKDQRFSIGSESERSTTTVVIDPAECRAEFERRELYRRRARNALRANDVMTLGYEALAQEPSHHLRRIQRFLGIEALDLDLATLKQETRPLSDVIENFDELRDAFLGTRWERFFF